MSSIKKVDKKLLLNHVRHAGSHNKLQEEKEMWQLRERERQRETGRERERDDWSVRANVMADSSLMSHSLVSDTYEARHQGSDTPSLSPSPPSHSYYSHDLHHKSGPKKKKATPSNYWTRQLMKAEEADPFRWGHSGYKDQHPEEFISTESSYVEEDEVEKTKKKKKRKKKEKSKERKSGSKHERRESKKRKRRRKEAEYRYCEDTDYSSSEDIERKAKKDDDKRKKRKRKARKDKYSDSDSSSEDSIELQKRKKKKRLKREKQSTES